MWDLDTIIRQNEEAHRRAVERAMEQTQQVSGATPAPVFPLTILARLLITGPPSLSHLIDLLADSDTVASFHALVNEFLPEHEAFIMSQDTEGRIREFAYYFSRQYFPLSDNIFLNEDELEVLILQIPVDLMGFTSTDYHEFNDFREGYILMLALVESPYVDDGEGGRIPILERVRELVGKELVNLIPPEGWSLEDLRRMLDGTKFAGVVDFTNWVHSDTGCWQLDADYEGYEGEQWSHHIVDQLTIQWPQVVDIQDRIQRMSEWLEEDIYSRFQEILVHLLDRKDLIIPKEQLPLPLDENGQIIGKEVIQA